MSFFFPRLRPCLSRYKDMFQTHDHIDVDLVWQHRAFAMKSRNDGRRRKWVVRYWKWKYLPGRDVLRAMGYAA